MQVRTQQVSRTRMSTLNIKNMYDVLPAMQSETGILMESNDAQFLDLRTVYYTGLIYNNMEHKTLGKVYFIAAGYQTLKSTDLPAGLPKSEQEKPIIYALQTFVVK